MSTGRENMSIWLSLSGIFRKDRFLPKRYHMDKFLRNLRILINPKIQTSDVWYREMIIKDSFVTPYNKLIGCRMFGHNWSTEGDFKDNRIYCWKCEKWSSRSDIRNDRINRILR